MNFEKFENELSDKELVQLIKEKFETDCSNTSIYYSILMMHELSYMHQMSCEKYSYVEIQDKEINVKDICTIYDNSYKELFSNITFDDVEDENSMQFELDIKIGTPKIWTMPMKKLFISLVDEETKSKTISVEKAILNIKDKIKTIDFEDDPFNKYRLLKAIKTKNLKICRIIYYGFKKEFSKKKNAINNNF